MRGAKKKNRLCEVEGCGLPHLAKGYCRKHYDRNLKTDPEKRKYLNKLHREWIKRKDTPPTLSDIVLGNSVDLIEAEKSKDGI